MARYVWHVNENAVAMSITVKLDETYIDPTKVKEASLAEAKKILKAAFGGTAGKGFKIAPDITLHVNPERMELADLVGTGG